MVLDSLFLGNSFVGDSILNLALMRAIKEKEPEARFLFPILSEMEEIIKDYLLTEEDRAYIHPLVWDDVLNSLCDPTPKVKDEFYNGSIFSHYPSYYETFYQDKLDRARRLLVYANSYEVRNVYNAHFFYGQIVFTKLAKKEGWNVYGFNAFHPNEAYTIINFTKKRKHGATSTRCSPLFSSEFIGDYLCEAFTGGEKLKRDHFYIKVNGDTDLGEYTLIMPSTRSKFQTAGYWDLDVDFFIYEGENVVLAFWEKDVDEELYNKAMKYAHLTGQFRIEIIHHFKQLIDLIRKAKLVVTNDSGQFHISWILGKPIIVKLKEYINFSWIPPKRLIKESMIVVPAMKMFPSEYLENLRQAYYKLMMIGEE